MKIRNVFLLLLAINYIIAYSEFSILHKDFEENVNFHRFADIKSITDEKAESDLEKNLKIKSYIIHSSDKATDPIEVLSEELKIKKCGIEIIKDNKVTKKINFHEYFIFN